MLKKNKKFVDHFESLITNLMPGNSVDCVIFRYDNMELQVLLLKWKNADLWVLPGGFVEKNDDLDDAAKRVVRERVGIKSIFLNQFYTFGDYNRQYVDQLMQQLENLEIKSPLIMNWFTQRFITTAYLALVKAPKTKVSTTEFISSKCEWISLSRLPELAFDHREIIQKAHDRLKTQLNYLPIGKNLLSETFTMKELQKLYETILGVKLDRGNFQRKILKLNLLIRLEKQYSGGAHKAPYLYRFDEKRYAELNEKGIGFIK